ncbi:MAG: glycosyltransferase [Bacteroidales bacterium]|nr:glycosyltransferase [Bacteroidales bacterium]
MKFLLVSTNDKEGGAAIACMRIFKALRKYGADEVNMLVRKKETDEPGVYTVNTNFFRKCVNFISFCLERLQILFMLRFRKKYLYQVSLDNFGAYNLVDHPLVKEADVINFHWTSQAMLSLKQLQTLLDMGKHVVFTMHDMHYFTGICHYASSCTRYLTGCGNCYFLGKGKGENDISRRLVDSKLAIFKRQPLTFVGCSRWLTELAKQSKVFKGMHVLNIPNPIDTSVYRAIDKDEAREQFGVTGKSVVLFGAYSVKDRRKGFHYLAKALAYIHEKFPGYDDVIELLTFGKGDPLSLQQLPYRCKSVGYVGDEKTLVALYSAADVFVTPTLEDNLPNTVMEALSCSVPCVSFDVGGLSQLIDHKRNGYLAKYRDHADLAKGIMEILQTIDRNVLRHAARKKVEENFSETVIAMQYSEIFRAVRG